VPPPELPPDPLPEGWQPPTYAQRIAPALAALGKDGWFEADQIIACLPGMQVAAHAITLPFTERKQIDATLPGEVEEITPFDPADVVFDSHLVTKAPGKTEMLVAVAQRAHVVAALEALKAAGADPAVLTFSALSLASLFQEKYALAAQPDPADPNPVVEALIDLGAQRTNVLILENGEARFARTASPGANDVTQALARSLGISPEGAEELKRAADLGKTPEPDGSDTNAIIRQALGGLLRELRSTFGAYGTRTRRKVTRVRITGGGSRLQGLAPFLANALTLPVDVFSWRPGATLPAELTQGEGALAVALALRGLNGAGTPKLNFRRGDLAYAQNVGETRSLYVRMAAMAAVITLLFGGSVWARLHALEKREAQLDKALCDATTKIYKKCETDYRVALAHLKGQGTVGSDIPQLSSVDLTVIISELFPQSDDTVLNDLDIVDGSVRFRGTAKNYEAIDDFVSDLQGNKCFSDVKKGQLEQNKAGKVEFQIEATYACEGMGKAGT
jgi:type IV pilus assembly protein PilM